MTTIGADDSEYSILVLSLQGPEDDKALPQQLAVQHKELDKLSVALIWLIALVQVILV